MPTSGGFNMPGTDDESKLNWDFQLFLDGPEKKVEAEAPPIILPPKVPPRVVINSCFPRISDKIELLWGSVELHKYFEQTLYADRGGRAGFPQDVMVALGEIASEHAKFLKSRGILGEDVWDKQFGK
jgi:hypothetical protein